MRGSLALVAVPLALASQHAWSQDLDTSQLQQHSQVVTQDNMTRSLLRSRGAPARTYAAKEQRARATCANRGRAAALHGMDDPKVRELYRLCGVLGFK